VGGVLLTRRVLGFSVLAVFLAVFPFLHGWPFFGRFISEFRTFNATMFAVWLLVVLSMNLLTGYSGQISLGHAGVMLIGAYTTAILFDQYGVPLALAVLIAGLFTGAVGGVIIGIPAVRLAGPYLAIATFALIVTMPQILKIESLTRWTNGAMGIPVAEIQPPGFVDGILDQRQWLYYATMVSAVVMTILLWNLTSSRIGRAFIALRDSEIGAEQMGVNVRRPGEPGVSGFDPVPRGDRGGRTGHDSGLHIRGPIHDLSVGANQRVGQGHTRG
jgi:branched-chain amino acid transport system permease protein